MKLKKILSSIITIAMLATMGTGVSAYSPEDVLYRYDIKIANTQPIVLSPEENAIMLDYLASESPDSPFVSTLSARSQVVLSPEEFFELLVDSGIVAEEFLNDITGKTIEINNPNGLASIHAVAKENEYKNDYARASYTRTDSFQSWCLACVYNSTIKLTSRFINGTDL